MQSFMVQSSNGDLFEVNVDFVQSSTVFRNMLEDLGSSESEEDPIPLPNVDSAILKKILEWITMHKDGSAKAAEIRSFFCKDSGLLIDLIRAADFLDIKGLLDEACRQMAIDLQFSYTTADQIRKAYGYEGAEDGGSVPFDGLPLDVRLDIFARVGEASELLLLEVLPAVSESWRELARHPDAWQRVDAWHLSDSRILRDAPALRDVELTLSADLLPFWSPRLKALCESRVVVQRRLAADLAEIHERGRIAVFDMLWRSRRALRSLELDLRAVSPSLTDSEQRSPLAVLAAMEKLEELDLTLDAAFPYDGQLAGKLTGLCKLKYSCDSWTPGSVALLADVLEGGPGGHGALRVLQLGPTHEPAADAARLLGERLERCAELRELKGPVVVFAAAAHFPKLAKLEAVFRAEHFIGGNVNWRENFSQLLERMKSMPSLQEVSLNFYIDELPNSVFEGVLLTLYSFKENTGRPAKWFRYSFKRE